MSIFKTTFSPTVKEQLNRRQEAMVNRTAKNLQYINSRNAWIRMSSSVDIVQIGPEGVEEGNKDLAKKYILQGGALYDKQLRAGIGGFNKVYSNTASDGTAYRLGIRPMPGITNIDVKSKSAYGSLREATVNFQCWDIKQLEDLELLYMRPGYTVLLEWGWSPYLDNSGGYNTAIEFYDIIDTIKPKEEIWKEIYAKTTDSGSYVDDKGEKKVISHYHGNYDAMFGFVKNYSWSARPDGGYDCQTTIISMGEIVESLKVNYTPTVNINEIGGLLRDQVADDTLYLSVFPPDSLSKYYQKNILSGLWKEVYDIIYNNMGIVLDTPLHGKTFKQIFKSTDNSANTSNTNTRIDKGGVQCYITLEAIADLINTLIIPVDTKSGNPLMKLSLKGRDGEDLQCVAHPMQISTDITCCLINSPLWSGGVITEAIQTAAQDPILIEKLNTANRIATAILEASKGGGTNPTALLNAIRQIRDISTLELVNQKIIEDKTYKDFEDLLKGELEFITRADIQLFSNIRDHLKIFNVSFEYTPSFKVTYNNLPIQPTVSASQFQSLSQNAPQTLAKISYLKDLIQQYFPGNDPYIELGNIKNIYVNVNFLYQLSLDLGLETQDRKEKSEINLYDYIKRVMSTIQSALGNVSTFDLHVDPIDNNIARIIDVNYTGGKGKSIYESLFELQVHKLNSVVRNYSMQSQIFPEQSTIIAIGSQAEGGQLGVQNNTMIDFNRKIRDRILPEKVAPVANTSDRRDGSELIGPLYQITQYLGSLENNNTAVDPSGGNAGGGFTDVKNALRDIIVYFQTITSSPGKNRSIIPIKFSFEMDGIGGLVIGHMFRLPKDILPKGYKGEGMGTELGQVVTSIGHTLSNNDWVTKIDALNIVLIDNTKLEPFSKIPLSELLQKAAASATSPTPPSAVTGRTGGATKEFYGELRTNGQVDDLLVEIRADLRSRHNSSVNKSDAGRIRLQSAAMQNLEALLTDAYNAGIYLKVNSAYRTYDDQVRIKNELGDVAAPAGTSNHGFGLAVDLADRNEIRLNPITTKKEWIWIQNNKEKYGFEGILGFNETHHFNYTGALASTPPNRATPSTRPAPAQTQVTPFLRF